MRKETSKWIITLLIFIFNTMSIIAQESTYTYTFTESAFDSSKEVQTLGEISWLLDFDSNYLAKDGKGKGQQIGSSTDPASFIKLSTSDIKGFIKTIKVSASTASSAKATLQVSVNGDAYGSAVNLTTSNTEYRFTGNSKGEILIEYSQPSTKKALYIKKIEIIYLTSTKSDANLSFSPTQLNLETGQTQVIEFTKATTADVTFTSSNESVATYDAATSTITAIAPGTTTITATSEANEQYEAGNATLVVTVKNPVKPANLAFSPTEIELGVGATQVVEFTKSTTADVTFTNSNESVATYDAATSTITAIAPGTATITAASQENEEYSAGSATLIVNVVKTFAGDIIFYESFDTNDYKGGNDGNWDAGSGTLRYDNDGWIFSSGYGAQKCIKLGTGSGKGSATTPQLGYAGTAKLSFRAGAWDYSKEKTTIEISVSGGGEIIGKTTVELVKGEFTDYTFPLKGLTADSKITFSASDASNNRFFLDEVKVEKLHVELNETSATAPEEKAITDVTLNRTFNADRWNPVCLPFAITAEQITEWFGEDSEVAEYIGDEESNGNVTVKFRKKTDGMNANTPYLLFPKKNVTVSKFPAVEIITTDMPKSEGTIFDFVGTYTNQPKGSSEIQMGDYIVSGGIFKKASGRNAIKAFRAYLRQRDVSNAKTVSMLFEDETTGISELKDNVVMPTVYYDLQGRRVADPSKGIYIVNGKKVIIK